MFQLIDVTAPECNRAQDVRVQYDPQVLGQMLMDKGRQTITPGNRLPHCTALLYYVNKKVYKYTGEILFYPSA